MLAIDEVELKQSRFCLDAKQEGKEEGIAAGKEQGIK